MSTPDERRIIPYTPPPSKPAVLPKPAAPPSNSHNRLQYVLQLAHEQNKGIQFNDYDSHRLFATIYHQADGNMCIKLNHAPSYPNTKIFIYCTTVSCKETQSVRISYKGHTGLCKDAKVVELMRRFLGMRAVISRSYTYNVAAVECIQDYWSTKVYCDLALFAVVRFGSSRALRKLKRVVAVIAHAFDPLAIRKGKHGRRRAALRARQALVECGAPLYQLLEIRLVKQRAAAGGR